MRPTPGRAPLMVHQGSNLRNLSGHTSQPYRGLVLQLFVFPAIPPACRPEWVYEVMIENGDGACLCGPYFSLAGYGTQRAAEGASLSRARIAADRWLGEI